MVRFIAVTACLVLIHRFSVYALYWVFSVADTFTLRKLECLKQALRLNNVAWNNRIWPRFYSVGLVEQQTSSLNLTMFSVGWH